MKLSYLHAVQISTAQRYDWKSHAHIAVPVMQFKERKIKHCIDWSKQLFSSSSLLKVQPPVTS